MADIKDIIEDRADASFGIRQMLKLVGIQSVKGGTNYEEDTLAQEAADIRCEVYGECGEPMPKKKKADDDMRDLLAAGPVTINQGRAINKGTVGKVATMGLAAMGLGTAIALPILAWNLTRPDPVAEVAEPELGVRFVPLPDPRG